MLRQPRNSDRRPPITGARAGAIIGPFTRVSDNVRDVGLEKLTLVAYPIHIPRSELVAMSATTPFPSAIVALLPVAWRHRRMNRAAYEFCKARPMLAPM